MPRELAESVTTMNGELRIDHLNGLVTFSDGWNRMVLRITHLTEPIPNDVLIDIVALTPLTSYTPLQEGAKPYVEAGPPGSWQPGEPKHIELGPE